MQGGGACGTIIMQRSTLREKQQSRKCGVNVAHLRCLRQPGPEGITSPLPVLTGPGTRHKRGTDAVCKRVPSRVLLEPGALLTWSETQGKPRSDHRCRGSLLALPGVTHAASLTSRYMFTFVIPDLRIRERGSRETSNQAAHRWRARPRTAPPTRSADRRDQRPSCSGCFLFSPAPRLPSRFAQACKFCFL